MKFICVLSIEGSLTSYVVSKQNDDSYQADLKLGNFKRTDVPETILLIKQNNNWQATPHHPEIVTALIHAIEAGP